VTVLKVPLLLPAQLKHPPTVYSEFAELDARFIGEKPTAQV